MSNYKEEARIADLLVKKTEDGPVESWLSRMRDVILTVGLKPSSVDWSGSPDTVARVIASMASRTLLEGLAKLEVAINAA